MMTKKSNFIECFVCHSEAKPKNLYSFLMERFFTSLSSVQNDSIRCRRGGSALLVVLGVVMVITILSFAYISRSDIELACGDNMLDYVKTDYLAQSGLEHAKGLILNPQEIPDEYWQGADKVTIEANSSYYYDVTVEPNDNLSGATKWCNYNITAEGYHLSGGERKAQSSLQAILRLDPAIALWSGSILQTQLGSNVTINGDAYFAGSVRCSGKIRGDVFSLGAATISGGNITGQKMDCNSLSLDWPVVDVGDAAVVEIETSPLSSSLGPYNPPRLFNYSGTGDLTISGGVRIEGALIVDGNLVVEGIDNFIVSQKNLPALLINGDLTIAQDSQLDIEGLAIVQGKVRMDSGSEHLNVLGGLFTRGGIENGQRNITITAAPVKTAVYVTVAGELKPQKWSQAPTAFYKDIRRN